MRMMKKILGGSNELIEEDVALAKLPSSFLSRKIIQNRVKKYHRKVLLSNFHLNREIHLRKIEPPCKLLELNLNCLICVQFVRPFKTLTASVYYISVFSIEFKKIGVET